LHLVAGRHNIAELVVAVCGDCHRVLTNWQYAAGIELRPTAVRHPTDVRRALGVGAVHVLQLMQQRNPIPVASDEVFRLIARAISRVLDLAAAPERGGRWLPDPVIEPHLALPTITDPRNAEVQQRELLYFVGELLRLLGDMPPITVEVWERVILEHRSMPERLAAIDAGDHAGPTIAILIEQYVQQAGRIVRWLLTVEDWSVIDERDLDEARVWVETGQRILEKIAQAALLGSGDAA
jgi:hypothetical protein